MKCLLIVAAMLASSALAVPAPYKFVDDAREFFELIRFARIAQLTVADFADNAQLGDMVKYVQAPLWDDLLKKIRADPNLVPLKRVLAEKNVDLSKITDQLVEFVKNAKLGTAQPDPKKTLQTWWDSLGAQIPLASLPGFFARKQLLSAEYRDVIKVVKTKQSHDLADSILLSDNFKVLQQMFLLNQADLKPFFSYIYKLLEWGEPPL